MNVRFLSRPQESIISPYTIVGKLSAIELRKVEAAGRTCPVRLTLGDQVEVLESYQAG